MASRNLRGDVDLLGLGNMLQLFAINQSEGQLSVARGRERQNIHFSPLKIRLLSSTVPRVMRIRSLATQALGKRPLKAEQLRKHLKAKKLLGSMLGHLVLSGDTLRREKLEAAIRHQVKEEILDMFVWQKARFEFREGPPPRLKKTSPIREIVVDATATSLLLEAARRADEVLRVRHRLDDATRLIRTPRDILADELGEDLVRVDAILPLIRKPRTLRSVLRASIYPEYATIRAVDKLVTLGYLRIPGQKVPETTRRPAPVATTAEPTSSLSGGPGSPSAAAPPRSAPGDGTG